MKKLNKKGQLMQNIGGLGIGIVTLAIILAVTFVMMSLVKTNAVTIVDATSVTNESVTWANNTWTALTFSPGSMELTCSAVYINISGTETIGAGNYTCGRQGINVINVSIGKLINQTVGVDYSYKPSSTAYNSTNTLTAAASTIPGWVALVVLVSIGGIILGLVSAFKRD